MRNVTVSRGSYEYCYCGSLFHSGNGNEVFTFAGGVAKSFGKPAIEDGLLVRDIVDGGLAAVVAGSLVDGDDGLGLEFGDHILNSALAEAGEADEIDIAAAEEADGGGFASFAALKHEAVDGILTRGETVGDALYGAEADGTLRGRDAHSSTESHCAY